jgi:hypothetical protein
LHRPLLAQFELPARLFTRVAHIEQVMTRI